MLLNNISVNSSILSHYEYINQAGLIWFIRTYNGLNAINLVGNVGVLVSNNLSYLS